MKLWRWFAGTFTVFHLNLESTPNLPFYFMKHNRFSHHQNQTPVTTLSATSEADLSRTPLAFIPSPDEVARKAYFSYMNEGSRPGRDVQHWLEAEKQLIEERALTRTHGFHNRT